MKMCWLEHGQWGLARNPYWGCPGPAALLQASGTQGPSCSHLVASHLQTRCRVAVVPASRDGEGGSVRGRGVAGSVHLPSPLLLLPVLRVRGRA